MSKIWRFSCCNLGKLIQGTIDVNTSVTIPPSRFSYSILSTSNHKGGNEDATFDQASGKACIFARQPSETDCGRQHCDKPIEEQLSCPEGIHANEGCNCGWNTMD